LLEESAQRNRDGSKSETQPFNYTSIMLKQFMASFEQLSKAQLLDIGPVYQDNITYFSQRVARLYLCNLYRLVDKDRQTGCPAGGYWRHLDYPDHCVDGILLWDLVDRLNDPEAHSLVERCYAMTKPGGMAMLFTFGKQVSPSGKDSCVVRDDCQIFFRELMFSNLPVQYRQNRDILHILSPFVSVKSLIYRNGIREFLFQKA